MRNKYIENGDKVKIAQKYSIDSGIQVTSGEAMTESMTLLFEQTIKKHQC